jgi:hypothetical protein
MTDDSCSVKLCCRRSSLEKTFLCYYSDDWMEPLYVDPEHADFPPNWNWRKLSPARLSQLMRSGEAVPPAALKIARRHGAVVEVTECGLKTYYAPGSRWCPSREEHLIRSLTTSYARVVELGSKGKRYGG